MSDENSYNSIPISKSIDERPTEDDLAQACPWRIRKLRCNRHLEQTAAMVPPSVVVKDGMGGRRLARSFSRSAATERLVNAIFVVIISELFQLSPQVDCVPD
jgi:hypothetical protein